MRLVTLTLAHNGRKVVIDADKVLSIWDCTLDEPAAGKVAVIRTAIEFQGDYKIDNDLLVVNQTVDEVVNRIRSAIALNERI